MFTYSKLRLNVLKNKNKRISKVKKYSMSNYYIKFLKNTRDYPSYNFKFITVEKSK